MPIKFLKRKIDNLATRAVVKRFNVNKDTQEWEGADEEIKGKLLAQVLGLCDEVRSDVEHLQQYGLRSIPLDGSRGILIAYGGSKDNASLITVDDKRFGQFTLQPGDVCIYSKNGAHTIYRDQEIIETIGDKKTITIGTMTIISDGSKHEIKIGGMTANIDSSGLTITNGDVVADGISLKTHTHPIASGSSAPGPTGQPT